MARMDNMRKTKPVTPVNVEVIDYKNAYFLRRFLNSQGKMYPPKKYGLTAPQQRELAKAIKRARYMALVPYVIK